MITTSYFLNLENFFYNTFTRSLLAFVLSIIIVMISGSSIIALLRKWQLRGQPISEHLAPLHRTKQGTPTMGGIIIIIAIIAALLIIGDLNSKALWAILGTLVSFGMIGFLDDYLKVRAHTSRGLVMNFKLWGQVLASLGVLIYIKYYILGEHFSYLTIPFTAGYTIDLTHFYLIFGILVITGASNAVNLTDGLDGLAIVPIFIAVTCFGFISYLLSNKILIQETPARELLVICGAIGGASLGFLWFNTKPATVFMGDIGSLALGAVLGVISILLKHELVLVIIGGVFVIEVLSVILQVGYFKLTKGKRIFLMAPLHHHFEKLGWPETKIVTRFWIIAVCCGALGLLSISKNIIISP